MELLLLLCCAAIGLWNDDAGGCGGAGYSRAVTIRPQLEKHRAENSFASCHDKLDAPGFALESFHVMGGWRTRYRANDENVAAEKAIGKNGHPFEFHYALPVDASGALPGGRG